MSFVPSKAFEPVLNALGILPDQLIGKGIEALVFSYEKDQVLKIYFQTNRNYLEEVKNLQSRLVEANLPYHTPLIQTIGEVNGIYYSVEKRLDGQNAESVFSKLSSDKQAILIKNFLSALEPLRTIDVSDLPFGQILDSPDAMQAASWRMFLLNMLHQKIDSAGDRVAGDVTNFPNKIKTLQRIIENMLREEPQKNFIHGDYYLANILVNDHLEITAILDISTHASVGDYRLDLANIAFQPLFKGFTTEHLNRAKEFLIQEYGESITAYLELYEFYYAFYFSNLYKTDLDGYNFCLSILNDKKLWEKYF